MKKKVFSLMMMLLLAFMGVAKAETVVIGDGTSGTTYMVPFNSLYGYSFTEQVFLASEVGTAGSITSISFNLGQSYTSEQTNTIALYMKNVSRETFSSSTDYEPVTAADVVYSGSWTIPANYTGWVTINLDTPFAYDGTSNLMVAMHESTQGYSTRYFTYNSVANSGISYYSDSYNPDPYSLDSYSGSKVVRSNRNNIQMEVIPGGGAGVTQTITIGEGTTTYYYYPVNMYFNYSLTEQIYTADEIGTAGTISSIAFYYDYTSSFSMDNITLYMKNVSRDAFASNTDMEPLALGDIVWTGTLSATEAGWIAINLDTPFAYDGTSNLLVAGFDGTSGYPGSSYKFRTSPCDGYKGINWYSDSYTPDPYNTASGFSGSKNYSQYRSNIQLTITTAGGGGGGFADHLHVKYLDGETEIIDSLNLGVRPINAWMEPFNFTMYTDGPAYTVTVLDFTPSDGMFSVEGEDLPFNVTRTNDVDLVMGTNATVAGVVERQFVAITEGNRAAHIWPVVVEMYDPAIPDVWEKAYDFGTIGNGFSYQGMPSQITPTVLHNDYTLPFPEIPEGVDGVYKFTVATDMIINAHVDENAADGKVALYMEDFNGEGGPMATNNYTGLAMGGGSSAAPFEVQIGEGTTTTGYFPFYTLYNYSIAENLFLATELAEAGVTSAPMTSLSWYATNAPGYAQQGITIWMANVDDEALTTTSHIVTGMTKVYTGAMTPAIGWNEFVFNEGTFSWDGHSNVLIFCQRNNGAWNSTVSWQATSGMNFTCQAYRYQDSGAYDVTVANTMYTATVRPNIIMKGGNRERATVPVSFALTDSYGDGWNGAYLNVSATDGTNESLTVPSGNYNASYTLDINEGAHVNLTWTSGTWDSECSFVITMNGETVLSGTPSSLPFEFDIPGGGGSGSTTNTIGVAGPVIENLAIAPGTYYLVASATQADYDVFINVDNMPCPAIGAEGFAFNPQPADNEDEIEPNSVTLRWMVPEYATGWRLIFGTTYHPEVGHPQTIIYPEDGSFTDHQMASSYTVRNLWNNTNYFWRVEFNNDACPEGVSSPIWGFTTHLNVPQNLTAVDYTVFDDETIVLNWNAVVDRTYRQYNVYRDGEYIGHTTVNNIGNTTYTDGPLAYNMGGYTYYVTAVYDEGESAPSNTVNVKVSGRGNVDGHVYEQDGTTGIAGATVTMVGTDEFNVSHTYNFQTNSQGYYSGAVYAGSYNGSAAKDGYQTIDAPVQGNPIAITYNQTTSPIDYMLDENFDPVCTVIAEYYPDSLDPHSPYVKVYWGCGLPGEEIIEPFETGDFSLFDWQIDPTYPWSITTNNPYEGTYCMKSGGAGVANVVSNMTVTVNIPADGEMSFFGKISSESNWDYGYFYIDGVQKGSYTGAGSWGEKKFDITAGDHTFQWRYTKDGSVNSNDDCFYVDYITFYKRPEPVGAGWHTYCESEFNNAVGSNVGTSRWAYEYPVSLCAQYAGFTMTKVSLFSDNMYSAVGGNYTCNIYAGGNEPMAGTLVSTLTVDVPSNLNAWVDWDLSTPVNVTGAESLWVVWTANSTVSSWPAGCCDGLNDYGTWWSAGLEAGYGWEHQTYGTWTMRHYFNNRAGEGFYSYASDDAANIVAPTIQRGMPVAPVKGQEMVTTTCANPNAEMGAAVSNGSTRAFSHYRVYRTNCYNDGPYTEENTVVLACELHDTIYIDVDWPDVAPGIYKWGVGCVYNGNRGEQYESPITWGAPVAINRDVTAENTTNPVAGEDNGNRAPWDLLTSFGCTSGYQYGVASDGNFIYTSSWSASSTSQFYKYDMDGNFVEEFNVAGSGQIRDLTYDGQYFYGVANSSTIYCLDLANHTLVSSFTSAYGTQRCCGYDPVRDGFWVVGNWSGNLTLVDRTGAIQITGPAPTSASGVTYYKDENNVEHVFCFDNGSGLVYDYDIASNTITGTVFDFNNTPGATGTPGGCHVGNYGNKMAFFGDLQQTPNLIGIYELREATNPNPGPNPGSNNPVQEPRESEIVWSNCLEKDMYLEGNVDVTVLLNSADSPEGVTVTFTNYNEYEQELYPIAPIVLDETGYYLFDTFRKGEYEVKVELDGYEPITDSVSIWDPTSLRYVMIEIIYGVSDLYVSSTGWAMWGAEGMPVGPTPGPGGNGDTFEIDFEAGLPSGWTVNDANNDGWTWCLTSAIPTTWTYYASLSLDWFHNGSNAICSGSYINGVGALNPDEWLISAPVALGSGSQLDFWVAATDASYPADHFGVFVSTSGTNPSDFSSVQEWTLTAKRDGMAGGLASRDGDGLRLGTWYHYTVDLGAYAGSNRYIAFRHFNCYDQYIMCLDDVALTNGAKSDERHLEYFKVMCESLDHEPIFNANTEHPFCQVATDELVPGEHYICKVAAVYSTGMSSWSEVEWQYIPCDNYAGTLNGIEVNGTTVTWDYPNGTGPVPPPGGGDEFMYDFENSSLSGLVLIDGGSPTGYGWQLGSTKLGAGYGHNASNDLILSQSYDNNYGVIYPDNYVIFPLSNIGGGSTFSFWACAQDANYAAEHFGVAISTTGTNAGDFSMVNEWTIGQKGDRYNGPRGMRDQSAWTQYSVDLSAYAGQQVYLAIRHFNCSDMFYLDVDDVELSNGGKGNRAPWEFFNGYVTDPGAMSNGGDASWIKGSQGTYGPGCQMANSNRVGDSFTLDAATTISEIEVYGYQTGSSTNSTFNGLYVQIYNGNPMNGGQVVWGDANANIMTATAFTNCYRGSDGDATGTTRPIMSVTASGLNIELEAGTYYLVYQLNGTGSSGPWANPHAEPGIGNTGNGIQWLGSNSAWQNLSDSGSGTPYGIAMKLSGNTGSGPTPPPSGDVLGAMVFLNGEWEAFVPYPTNEYTYNAGGEYCVRMVYNGTNTLPEGNIYYSMSCPECEGGEGCAAGAPIYAEELHATDQVKIWWGDAPQPPQPPMEEWLYYDDGTIASSVGAGGAIYWGVMFPANSLAPYAGTSLTKVALMEYNAGGSYTLNVHLGGTNAPGTLAATQTVTTTGTVDWKEIVLNNPVLVDGTQNLWITFYQAGLDYPATCCANTGDANGRWVSIDGVEWDDLMVLAPTLPYTWMVRGFVTNQGKAGEVVELPEFKGEVGGELSNVVLEPKTPVFDMSVRSDIVKYNVYRSTDNANYTMIGEVAEDGSGYYEYIDTPEAAGTYYYQVKALYNDGCESEPALSGENPDQNYVVAGVDALGENNGNVALFPNPTKGNVTIQAAGMSRITVVSVLGQVVYDTELNADEYTLNMAQFNAGMYMVRIHTEEGVTVKRVTVMQ